MKVGKIKKLDSGKYKVQIGDTVLTTYDDVILKNGLLFQKELTEEDYRQLEIDNIYADVFHKTLQYALRKVRCIREVTEYLEKFEIPSDQKEKMVQRLQQMGIVSDEAYVKAFISDSVYLSNDGPNKIQNLLLAQEIDENLVADEMSKIDEKYIYEKLKKLIMKKVTHDKKHSNYQLQQKIVMDMVNLGYEKDMILEILSSISFSDDEKLEKEFQKILMKYSKKYEGKDLYYKIKEKLYSKGFDIHDIEEFLQKKD